jgi:hypothetical protein
MLAFDLFLISIISINLNKENRHAKQQHHPTNRPTPGRGIPAAP